MILTFSHVSIGCCHFHCYKMWANTRVNAFALALSITGKPLFFLPGTGLGLGCLMTPGLSKDIGVMYNHTFLNLQITRSDIRPHIKWSVWWLHMISLIFLRGLCGYIWVTILTLSHTHPTPRGSPRNGPNLPFSRHLSLVDVVLMMVGSLKLI